MNYLYLHIIHSNFNNYYCILWIENSSKSSLLTDELTRQNWKEKNEAHTFIDMKDFYYLLDIDMINIKFIRHAFTSCLFWQCTRHKLKRITNLKRNLSPQDIEVPYTHACFPYIYLSLSKILSIFHVNSYYADRESTNETSLARLVT